METLQSVAWSFRECGDRLAVLTLREGGTERWSFAQLRDHVRRLGAGLVDAGVEPGEPVGVFAPNRPEWIVAALAVLEARGVVVPIDAQSRGEELAHFVRDSGTRRVFTVRDHARRLDELWQLPVRPDLHLLDTDKSDARSWRRLFAKKSRELAGADPHERAALFYTAGTTGKPKGVPLTHENCASNLAALLHARIAGPDDHVLLPLPFHHVYPFMIGIMAVLASGAALVLPAGLTGPQLVRALRDGEVTTIVGVPRFYEALVSGLKARVRARGRIASATFRSMLGAAIASRRVLGLRPGRIVFRAVRRELGPRVRVVASGGARLDPDVARTLEALGWEVCSGYGLTETSPILAFNVPGQSRLQTAGRPLRGVELTLDDPDGDGVGEVLARGPNVFHGYHHLPDKTAEVFTTDGRFRTGDLGRFDRAGYLEIVGRASEILVLAEGKHVVPEDVEKVYLEHPAIREIGLLLRAGRLAAVIVPDPARARTREVENAVRDAIAGQSRRLHAWQRVADYAITRESLPRTRLGKLRRHLLPDLYERARQGGEKGPEAQRPARLDELSTEDRALLEHPAAGQVWEWLTTRYREQRVTPDTSPRVDLGVDSLEWLNLTLEARARAGIELSDETIAGIETVRDLLRAATEASEAASPAASPLERPEETLRPEQRRWIQPPGALTRVLGIGFYGLNRAVLRRLFAVRAKGLEHLPARDPFVLAPNHRSYLDPFVIACVVPRLRLETTYWGGFAPLLFANPPARLLSKVTHIVPVDPERAAISSLAVGAAVLARKRNLVWFPEGQRSRTGELQRFMPGLGMLLDHFRVPVVPVFVHGTEQALPPGRVFPRRVPVTVAFGPALDPEDLARRGRGKDAAERITGALRDAVAELGVRVAGGRRAPAA